eukprot:gene16133-7494_t
MEFKDTVGNGCVGFSPTGRVYPEDTSCDTEGDIEVPVPLQVKKKHQKQLMLKRRRQLQKCHQRQR